MNEFDPEIHLNVKQAAKFAYKCNSAIFAAMKRQSLKYVVIGGKKYTTKQWLIDYQNDRYNKQNATWQGKKVFDYKRGMFSVKMAAEYLNTTIMTVYALINNGHLVSKRVRSYHVISKQHLDNYLKYRIPKKAVVTKKVA